MSEAGAGYKFLKFVSAVLAAALLVWLDQWTKLLVVQNLKNADPFVLIPGVLELGYVENTGAAFGILQGSRMFFLILTPVVCLFLLAVLLKTPRRKKYLPLNIILCFIMAGALGNYIDRLKNGYVVDFIYFKPIDFPLFNVADIFITVGFAVLLLLIVFYYNEEDLDFLSK